MISGRRSEIALFEAFKSALKRFMKEEYALLGASKYPQLHRLAIQLEKELPPHLRCDMLLPVKLPEGESTPDLVVNDRAGNILLAVYVKDGYLSKTDQEEARRFHDAIGCLTLAFSFLEGKPYFLIYRFGVSFIDYLHISKEDYSESVLRRRGTEEEKTQSLFPVRKRRTSTQDQ